MTLAFLDSIPLLLPIVQKPTHSTVSVPSRIQCQVVPFLEVTVHSRGIFGSGICTLPFGKARTRSLSLFTLRPGLRLLRE